MVVDSVSWDSVHNYLLLTVFVILLWTIWNGDSPDCLSIYIPKMEDGSPGLKSPLHISTISVKSLASFFVSLTNSASKVVQ